MDKGRKTDRPPPERKVGEPRRRGLAKGRAERGFGTEGDSEDGPARPGYGLVLIGWEGGRGTPRSEGAEAQREETMNAGKGSITSLVSSKWDLQGGLVRKCIP